MMPTVRPFLLATACVLPLLSAPLVAGDVTDDPNTLIATVNGVNYPLDVFRVFYNDRVQQSGGQNTPEMQELAFNEFLNLVVASQEAQARNLGEQREVRAALELQRMAILSTAALSAIAGEFEPTEEALRAAYAQLAEQARRTEYKARHILVDSESKAKDLIKQLDRRKGRNFEELAKEHSLGPTAENGGDLGWFDARQMVPQFSEALVALQPDSYTKEPVQTQFGWHVIKLEETRTAEPPSFEDARPQLEASVRRQHVIERLGDLRQNADVRLNEEVVRMKEPSATAE